VGAGRQQGVAGEHRWGPGVAPHRRSGGVAHSSGGSTRGGQSGGVGAEAVAGAGEESSPVSGGAVLWLEVEVREEAAARHRSEEGTIIEGGEYSADDGGSILKGSGGEGGPKGWAPRGGGVGERERERGGPSMVWSSTTVWHRCGSGPTASRAGGALPRDSGERRGRRDAGRRG
jgi:hypothetical protein